MRWAFPLPLGLSLSPDAIRAVRIARRGRRLRVAARRSVPLAQGALTVAPSGLAIADEAAVLGALKEALAPGRAEVALAIPDVCCVAQVQRFPELKARGQELRALLLWQAADLLPFPQKEARLACQVLHREGTAGQVAVLLTHQALLAQLETLLLRAGRALQFAASALICLHNVWDSATGGRGSEGLLHLGGGALGLLLREDGRPAFVRSVPLAGGNGQPAGIVREVEASLEYATTREGLSLPPGLLLAGEGDLPPIAAALERSLRLPVEVLGDGVAAWGASWEGLPPTAAEAAAAGAALSPGGRP